MKMELDTSNGVKYTLRTKSLMKRIESERSRQGGKKKEPKEKQKPPPLSKYRRKTANARERNRMREINEAFETLQKTLPHLPGVDAEKLTKITVLRLAVNYIKILSCVKDGEVIETKGIDELRSIWCVKNAHMARPEHCVRPVFKTSKLTSNQNKPLKVVTMKSKPVKSKLAPNNKPCETPKEKSIATVKKRSNKSRIRGKVCKTASVATSNGAYITLKNVAFQCAPNRKGNLDNKPIMMSMTVKRPRLEHVSFKKPHKIARYDPPRLTQPKIEKAEQTHSNCSSSINYNPFSVPFTGNLSPLLQSIPFNFVPPESLSPLEDKYLSSFTIFDLEKPVIKNDVVLESPNNNRHSSTSSLDSSLFSEESSLSLSPKSLSPLSYTPSYNLNLSPHSTRSFDTVSPYSSSETDIVLGPSMELGNLLDAEPLEEDLDHLTSLVDSDDALTLFLDHHSSNFICSDINSC